MKFVLTLLHFAQICRIIIRFFSSVLILDIPEITSLRAIPNKTYSGRNSAITCMARGVPTPQYKFYHSNGTLLQDSPAFLYPSTLRYEDYPDYKATFKCVPYNMMGEGAAQNVTVEILGTYNHHIMIKRYVVEPILLPFNITCLQNTSSCEKWNAPKKFLYRI